MAKTFNITAGRIGFIALPPATVARVRGEHSIVDRETQLTCVENENVSGRSSTSSDQLKHSREKLSSAATPVLGVASMCPPVGAAFVQMDSSAKPVYVHTTDATARRSFRTSHHRVEQDVCVIGTL